MRRLLGHIDVLTHAINARKLASVSEPGDDRSTKAIGRLTDDELIDVRDPLVAKRDGGGALTVLEQNILRDCDIALGTVRCEPEVRERARYRVARAVGGP